MNTKRVDKRIIWVLRLQVVEEIRAESATTRRDGLGKQTMDDLEHDPRWYSQCTQQVTPSDLSVHTSVRGDEITAREQSKGKQYHHLGDETQHCSTLQSHRDCRKLEQKQTNQVTGHTAQLQN